MNAQKTAIRILSATALVLLCAVLFLPSPAPADVTHDYDYVLATFATAGGNDALYVADTRAGAVAVFVYDPTSRALQPRAIRRLEDAFIR